MARLQIKLFGESRVWRGGVLVGSREWGGQKPRSLLKLLLTRPGRGFSRDEILEALWPGVPREAAERSLRVAVSLLRRALEPDLERGPDSRYVLGKRPGYAFERRPGCDVDAWRFEKHYERAEAAWEAGDLDAAVEECRAALELVEGEFLAEDPYEDWAIAAREEWRTRNVSVISLLSECLARKGRYTEAVAACKEALALERYSEELNRRLMLYRYCSGEQGLALSAYREYARALREQLNAVPSPELTRLKEQMEARDVPGVDEGRRRYPRPRRPLRLPYSLSRTRFVGREREYALLAGRLREAVEEGAGAAVAVEGEAGVGKTRLVEEFLGHARSRGARVLAGRCYERELGPPLEPVMEALEPLPGDTRPGPDPLTGPYEGARIYRALTAELVRESQREDCKGLVLFVDDVQWADTATLDFLAYLAGRLSGERVVLLFAYRREDAPALSGWLARLSERRAVSTLSLGRLSPGDLAELLGRLSSRGFEELPSLADLLYRESEGNPFYAVEYLRWLLEAGLVRVDSRRRVSGLDGEALREGVLPSGVRSLIGARLRRLDDGARGLLELASVVGRTLDPGLLCAAAGGEEAAGHDTLGPLLASGLVVETPEYTYRFSHDKLRQALYEGIDARRRRGLHLRVARVLEEAAGEPEELAHHYLRAEAWRPALESLVRAGREAEAKYYWEAALEDYSRALEALEKLPGSGEERFELLASRERLLEHTDRREERAATVEAMFELASRLGDRARVAATHVRRIGVLGELSDPTAAERAGREAVGIFRELGDAAGEALAHRELGYVLWVNGDHARALEAGFRALDIHRELGDRRGEVGGVGNIAEVYRGMGNYQQALSWTQESVRLYRELGDRIGEAMRLATVASIHHELGELEAALPLVLGSLEICTELGVKNLLVAQHSACGTLYLGLGDPHRALEHFRSAARLGRETGYTRDEGYSTLSVGAALERTGDPTGAAEAYRRASRLLQNAYEASGAPAELSGKADALILLAAVLHHKLQRPEEALAAYEAAAGVCRELDDRHRLRKVLLGSASLCWKTGAPEGAAQRYEEALALARERSETAPEAAALASLSVVYRDLGRLKESLRCGRGALGLMRDLDDPQAEAYVLSSLAESHERLGHYPSALSCLKRSLRLRRKVGDAAGEAGVLHDLAGVYARLGDAERAREASERATRRETTPEPARAGGERRS